ncbi:Rha family transcriptional regulator [Myroides marinus]|nr:phage regulatory protein/antirepressor Ant [Myroides marinus]
MNTIALNNTMSSREIATMTGKRHDHVIRDIEKLNENYNLLTLPKCGVSEYIDSTGRKLKCYNLTKIQTMDLMTGYRTDLRIKINRRWEELEKQNSKPNLDSITKKDLALLLLESEKEKETLLLENQRMKPRDEYIDKVFSSDGLLTMSEAAKSLGLDIGRNILYNILRDRGILFKGSKEPKQEYVNRGYFAMKQNMIQIKKGDATITKVEPQTMVTQKGLGYIAKLLGIVNVKHNSDDSKTINQ